MVGGGAWVGSVVRVVRVVRGRCSGVVRVLFGCCPDCRGSGNGPEVPRLLPVLGHLGAIFGPQCFKVRSEVLQNRHFTMCDRSDLRERREGAPRGVNRGGGSAWY